MKPYLYIDESMGFLDRGMALREKLALGKCPRRNRASGRPWDCPGSPPSQVAIPLTLNPLKVVENRKRIVRRSSIKADKGIFHLQKSLSLPTKSIKSVENIVLDKELDQSWLRSKSTSKLS
jgi:hypothetical protein